MTLYWKLIAIGVSISIPVLANAGETSIVDFTYYEKLMPALNKTVGLSCSSETVGDARAAMASQTAQMAGEMLDHFRADIKKNFSLIKNPTAEAQARFDRTQQAQLKTTRAALTTIQAAYNYAISVRMPASLSAQDPTYQRYTQRVARIRSALKQAQNNWTLASNQVRPPQSLVDEVAKESADATGNLQRLSKIGRQLDVAMNRSEGCLSVASGRSKMTIPFTSGNPLTDFQNAETFQKQLAQTSAGATSSEDSAFQVDGTSGSTKSGASKSGGTSGK